MALTRARPLHGPADLGEQLSAIVCDTLCRPRDPASLVRDVADMRDRIARHAPAKSPWDFKHLPGGLFDIDFVAQYLCLRHAPDHPEILHPHPAVLLERLTRAGLIDPADGATLIATRALLSDVQSLLRLTIDGDETQFDEARAPEGQRQLIAATEGAPDFAHLRARIDDHARRTHAIFQRIIEEPARAAGWQGRSGT
jgi:glutamate-ammonia-ligase adenylyltransferase